MASFRDSAIYRDAFRFLFGRIDYERSATVPYQPRDLHLGRMRRLLELLGSPEQKLPVIHIAGTKGKGSTATMIDALLRERGIRTGRYTSPHLQFVEERFSLNEQVCSPQTLVELITHLQCPVAQLDEEFASQGLNGPTYFEITTALAFYYFARESVDYAILEVGLGGRLDSTNVCNPVMTVITSISFDHMLQLGNTLPAIATEKAGIIKSGVPVISGVPMDSVARDTIATIAAERAAPLQELNRDFRCRYFPGRWYTSPRLEPTMSFEINRDGEWQEMLSDLKLGMLGQHQARNAAVALAAVRAIKSVGLVESSVRRAMQRARCPARIEIVASEPTVIMDAAHNVASTEALIDVLDEVFPTTRRILLLATTSGKDIEGMLRVLLPKVDHLVCSQYRSNPRAFTASQLYRLASSLQVECGREQMTIEICPDLTDALRTVRAAARAHDLVVIAGSFFVAGEAAELLRDGGLGS